MPRVLGYVFNPLSLFFCHCPSGELAAVVLEVNNTFGERHCLRDRGRRRRGTDRAAAWLRQGLLRLALHGPRHATYDFRLTSPGAHATTAILGRGADGAPIIAAAVSGARRAARPTATHRPRGLPRPSIADAESGRGDPLGGAEAAGQGRAAEAEAGPAGAWGDGGANRGRCAARRSGRLSTLAPSTTVLAGLCAGHPRTQVGPWIAPSAAAMFGVLASPGLTPGDDRK